MVYGFYFISITQFPAMICSVSAKGSLIVLLTRFKSFFFWLWVNHFCLICVHLLLVYHSAQLSHPWSDFNCSLRVMISESGILFHFILVLLSSTLMKQLTCIVDIFLLYALLDHLMSFWFALPLICFWLNLIFQGTSEFSLICADLGKVSTEDGGHVIS